MRWVTWVSWFFCSTAIAVSCGDSKKSSGNSGNDDGSGGEAADGPGGSTSGESGNAGSSGSSSQGGSAGSSDDGGAAGNGTGGDGGTSHGGSGGGTSGSGAGGEAGGGDGGSGGSGDARTFHEQFWAALCRQLMRCGVPNNDVTMPRLSWETEASCQDAVRELLGEEPPTHDLLAKIDAGAIRFLPDHAEACLAEAEDCMWRGQLPRGPACRRVFEGTVPLGGACERWEDCAGNAYCNHTAGCPGTCTALGEPGAACDGNMDCNPGDGYAFCDYWSASESVCARLPIRAHAALGQACTLRLEEASDFVDCEIGLWCDSGDGSLPTGTCARPIASGQPCDSPNDVCEDGTFCFDTSCEPVTIRHTVGETCDAASRIACDHYSALVCTSGTCQHLGDGSVNAPCRSSDIYERVTCDHGLYCARVEPTNPEGTCQLLLGADAPCTNDSACASGTCDTTCAGNYCDG